MVYLATYCFLSFPRSFKHLLDSCVDDQFTNYLMSFAANYDISAFASALLAKLVPLAAGQNATDTSQKLLVSIIRNVSLSEATVTFLVR